ncbi:TonB-dependent receptor [Phocaeicola abscessus]|uniref:TonB-dependent receptor plug domain-containing protein n=2 Tax=Phocaeicola abscessus TaxID=555313 RepID=UPI0028EB5F1F|nr:TonB-dependent receptor [Phocaeicola abscessus]
MMKNTIILSICLSICQSHILAQIHTSKADTLDLTSRIFDLSPIVVTGTGHHQRLKATTAPVHVLSKQAIHEQGLFRFSDAVSRMMPQISLSPSSMGSFLRLNGLGNKYILLLVNGKKLTGDISNNVDLYRIQMARVRRIEVLDGAASSLYGSDAIGGVINVITDQPTEDMISATTNTHASGKGKFIQSVNADLVAHGFGSYTAYTHDEADSYQNNDSEYVKGSTGETRRTIAPLFTGYHSDLFSQRFSYSPIDRLAFHGEAEVSKRLTDRPDTRQDVDGGSDYEMRHKSLRFNAGGIYKLSKRNSFQYDFTSDNYRYGKVYDVTTKTYRIGDYIQSKKQQHYENELKGIFGFTKNSTTIFGAYWSNDFLNSSAGSVDNHAYTLAGYAQHELLLFKNLKATLGARYNRHEAFGDKVTPKVTLMYSPRHFTFRATYSTGFRAPGLDELYYHYYSTYKGKPQIIFGNKRLQPEKSKYFSLNAVYHANSFSLSITGFMNFIDDMIVKEATAIDNVTRALLMKEFPEMTAAEADKLDRYTFHTNSDKGEVKGIQVSLSANAFNGFYINVHYSYTDARTKSGGKWTALDRSFKHALTLAVNYHHGWRHYAFNANIHARMQSETYYPLYENAPGYGIWNINTTHTFDFLPFLNIEPSLGIDNIFDKTDRRIDSKLRRYALFSPGRALTVGLKLRFKR